MDIDETFTQVRERYQNLQFQGWEEVTAESSTIHNNGKTGMSVPCFLCRRFWSPGTGGSENPRCVFTSNWSLRWTPVKFCPQ